MVDEESDPREASYPDVIASLVVDAGVASEEMSSLIKEYLTTVEERRVS